MKRINLFYYHYDYQISIRFSHNFIIRVIVVINTHVHEADPRGPKYYIFDHWFYSKNARKLRFYVFLFHAREYI